MKFRKMHGLGNDFVLLDFRQKPEELNATQIQQICDRNFGIGCDLLTVLERSDSADVFARFYNADGSESAACGNATRCVADIIMRENKSDSCVLETGRGLLPCLRADGGMVTVDMGVPLHLEVLGAIEDGLNAPVSVNMGNPHCVFFVDDLGKVNIESIGARVENNTDIFSEKTNVEFVERRNDGTLRQRTWERGVGVTLACGSGACAVAAAARHLGYIDDVAQIELDGGALIIQRRESDGTMLMTGPVAYVFDGEINL